MWSDAMNATLEEQVFEAGEGCQIDIQVLTGDLEISGWDKDQVSVESPDGPAEVHREGTTLKVGSGVGAGDLTVLVPRRCNLTAHVCNGDVAIEGADGQVNLEAMNGDIEAKGLRGALAVRAYSGDVSVLRSALSGLTAELFSGDCTIESALAEEGRYHLHSLSGDVHLLLAEDQRCTLSVRSLDGDVDCSLPHEVKGQNRHSSEIGINGGGVPFRVSADSGDITVEAAKELPEGHFKEASPATAQPSEPFDVGAQGRQADSEPFGLDESPTPEPKTPELMEILRAVERGELTVEEALARIGALELPDR
jgi:DUF4097 and DUF4098 domain-containing protein YvlB